jgi:hypothetical protein
MADMLFAASGGGDPMADGPWRIMTDVLLMATLQLRDPVELVVDVEANNSSRHTFQLRLRLHGTALLPGGIGILGEGG